MAAPTLADQAIEWFDQHGRDLPWRRPETTPWGVLVSEIMSQQTPVARVTPTWETWLDRWPTPAGLAGASTADAIRLWGRLGYPRRALRLHETSILITTRHAGTVPADLDLLLALPGVGGYTARAVAVFAFGQRHPVVDINVRRFATRALAGAAEPGAANTAADLARVEAALPESDERAARASAAFMELGALVCTARTPRCPECPVRAECGWIRAGRPAHVGGQVRRTQPFAGTDRQVRGLLLGLVRDRDTPVPRVELDRLWPDTVQRDRALTGLLDDGLLARVDADLFALPGLTHAELTTAEVLVD